MVEVVPLSQHDGPSVADAFLKVCLRWGPPRVVRCDNGTEFMNHVVSSLFDMFGAVVRTGAVRHPQSQGQVERFNRTLLVMIRKVLDGSSDWLTDLDVLLYFYRNRSHGLLKITPMEAMTGWSSRSLPVEHPVPGDSAVWVKTVAERTALIRDYVTEVLTEADQEAGDEVAQFGIGDRVMLKLPARRGKCQPLYERGWTVIKVLSPTTVVISKPGSRSSREKVINMELLKPDTELAASTLDLTTTDRESSTKSACGEETDDADSLWTRAPLAAPEEAEELAGLDAADVPAPAGGLRLRRRTTLQPHPRYADYECHWRDAPYLT